VHISLTAADILPWVLGHASVWIIVLLEVASRACECHAMRTRVLVDRRSLRLPYEKPIRLLSSCLLRLSCPFDGDLGLQDRCLGLTVLIASGWGTVEDRELFIFLKSIRKTF
jgi:hypothetical protein